MAALCGRDVLSSTFTMKVNSCSIEFLAFGHGTKSQMQPFLDSFEFFAFLLQQATVMAKHACDTYQKHAKLTNVHCSRPGISRSPWTYPSQGLNLKQASEEQQHVPQYISHRTKLLALKILHPRRAGGIEMFCYSEYWLSSDRLQAIGKSESSKNGRLREESGRKC